MILRRTVSSAYNDRAKSVMYQKLLMNPDQYQIDKYELDKKFCFLISHMKIIMSNHSFTFGGG